MVDIFFPVQGYLKALLGGGSVLNANSEVSGVACVLFILDGCEKCDCCNISNSSLQHLVLSLSFPPRKVTTLEDPDQNIHLKNLSLHQATTEEEALNLLFLGDTNRMIAEVTGITPPVTSQNCQTQ